MEGTASQPGFDDALWGGQVWLGGHGFVPGGPIGRVALLRSSLPMWTWLLRMVPLLQR